MSKKHIGFRFKSMMPNNTHREEAVGLTAKQRSCHPEYDASDCFGAIPVPTHEDDWLAQYVPDNQTYQRWERSTRPFRRETSGKSIYIVALGDLGEGAPQMDHLAEYTGAFFDPFPVKVLPPIKIISPTEASRYKQSNRRKKPKTAIHHYALVDFPDQEPVAYPLKSRRCHPYYEHLVHDKHVQLAIDPVLDVLEDFRPDDCLCFLAVTMFDLYEGNSDAFAVGMATGVKDKIGVFSFCRYDPLFDQGKAPKRKSKKSEDNYKTLLLRSCKVLAHEIGHLVGIEHCSYYDCMMNGSGHLQEDFQQSMHLCPIDLRKILTLTGTTWDKFYENLLAFFEKHGFNSEIDWIRRRVDWISQKSEAARVELKSQHRDSKEPEASKKKRIKLIE